MEMSDGHELRYVRPPVPLIFPSEEEAPETKRHLKLRTLLFELLELAFADRAAIGCDQFVYWDPTDPKACLAPDAFVRLGQPDFLFRSWKAWEHGAPHVAVEVISDADERDRDWGLKLNRYRRLGVSELVRFDPEENEGSLRAFGIWSSKTSWSESCLAHLHPAAACLDIGSSRAIPNWAPLCVSAVMTWAATSIQPPLRPASGACGS